MRMTATISLKPQVYNFEDLEILHYHDGNNGVLLRDGDWNVLIFFDGKLFGVTPNNNFQTVKVRVEPVFKAIIRQHNQTVDGCTEIGFRNAQYRIRRALGVN